MLAKELSNGRPESESGFLLLDRGRDALAWRLFMADQAERTLDAQYFLWKDDRMGRLFIQRLMDAAERGVRVRVLIDDSMTESDPEYLAKFAAHPGIEVRLYKPFGPDHKSFVFRWVDFLEDFRLLNRRMHNKLYIADDSFMIAGGRNIGEDYFEYLAPDVFRSRDLLGVGPIADHSSDAFDEFWNSDWAVPIEYAVNRKLRRLRHCFPKVASSVSAMLSQLPCLGVKWISSLLAIRHASAGSKASYNDAILWVLRLSITNTIFSASVFGSSTSCLMTWRSQSSCVDQLP